MPTADDIYQTYLKGPAALIRLFEQALGTQAIYGEPETDLQQRTIESQGEEIDRLKSQIARLQRELAHQRHQRSTGVLPPSEPYCDVAIPCFDFF
jgi:hypothetical protein